MKLIPALVVLFSSSVCFADTTTHHWFARVPVSRASEYSKKPGKSAKGQKRMKAFKGQKGNTRGQGAILTRVTTN